MVLLKLKKNESELKSEEVSTTDELKKDESKK